MNAQLEPGLVRDVHEHLAQKIRAGTPRSGEEWTPPSAAGWRMWRDFVVRSAGFPAAMVHRLSAPGVAAEADRLLQAAEAEGALWRDLRATVSARVDALLSAPAAPDGRSPEVLRLKKTASSLNARRLAVDLHLEPEEIERLHAAVAATRAHRAAYVAAFGLGEQTTGAALRDLACDPLLRRAVAWQNHEAIATALDCLRDARSSSGSRRRQREDLLANYLQRYATKNDTIGFFGPMAWARLGVNGEASRVGVDSTLIRSKEVRFEAWAIECLAAKIAADRRLLAWLTPTRSPALRLRDGVLQFPGGTKVRLDALEAEVLGLCDGVRTTAELLRMLPPERADDVRRTLETLAMRGRISLGFALPSGDPVPERALRRQLGTITDPVLRATKLAWLDALERRRRDVGDATSDAALVAALHALDAAFTEITGGVEARRNHGQAYGGRALVYEDCHRGLDFSLGEAERLAIQESLDVVLDAARWFTIEVAESCRQAFRALFEQLRGNADRTSVDFATFWFGAQPFLFGEKSVLEAPRRGLSAAWHALVTWAPGARRVDLSAGELRRRAAGLFDVPAGARSWPAGVHHCPDIMLLRHPGTGWEAAAGALAVLGEVHVGANTLSTNMFLALHPALERALDALRASRLSPHVVARLSNEGSGQPVRTQWIADDAADVDVLFSLGARSSAPDRSRDIGSLDVELVGQDLFAVDQRDGWRRPLEHVLGDFMSLAVTNEFHLFEKLPHLPRVTIGRLVVQRETWRYAVSALAFALEPDEASRFVEARRFAREQGWPRFLFVKAAWENKPFFVDLDSPLMVRILARQIRGATSRAEDADATVAFSEMLPSFDQLWLADADGERYASEFRLVAMHCTDWPGAGNPTRPTRAYP